MVYVLVLLMVEQMLFDSERRIEIAALSVVCLGLTSVEELAMNSSPALWSLPGHHRCRFQYGLEGYHLSEMSPIVGPSNLRHLLSLGFHCREKRGDYRALLDILRDEFGHDLQLILCRDSSQRVQQP